MSMVFPVSHSTSASLLAPQPCSLSSNTYYILLHIVSHFLLLPVTNSSLSPTLSSSISLHVLLLVHHNITRLFLLSVLVIHGLHLKIKFHGVGSDMYRVQKLHAISSVIQTCWNNLGLNLCVMLPTSHIVTISENGLIRDYKKRGKVCHH